MGSETKETVERLRAFGFTSAIMVFHGAGAVQHVDMSAVDAKNLIAMLGKASPAFVGPTAEALCLTEDADWEAIARKLGGRLSNREIADTGEYETLLVVPAPPETPKIACLCGSTRFYDQFQQAYYDLTMRGEIVLSVGFYPHAKAEHGHGEGVGHDSAEKTALDELHKRKIDLADYVLVVSDASGYFGESTRDEIRYATEQGKFVRFAERAAAIRALELGLATAEPPGVA